MLKLIVGRFLVGVPTLLAVSVCVFGIVRLIPGDPARLLAGDFATEQIVDELRQRWRLNDPLPVQYAAYLGGLVRGDLGRSITTSTPVLAELTERFLRTLELAVAAIAVAAFVGIAAGIVSAIRRATVVDYLATALALTGISTPIFWSGLILILLFSVTLEWLPAGGTGRCATWSCPPSVWDSSAPACSRARPARACSRCSARTSCGPRARRACPSASS
jgi:peptide/nickel transport system permease protein